MSQGLCSLVAPPISRMEPVGHAGEVSKGFRLPSDFWRTALLYVFLQRDSVTQIFSCGEIGDLSHEKGFISPTSLRKIERLAGLSEAKMTQVSERFLHEEQVNRVRLRIDSEQKGKAY